ALTSSSFRDLKRAHSLILFGLLAAALGVPRANAQLTVSELKSYSLEQLMGIEVTSASRKPEPFAETAAAVGVMTGQEIDETGAQSLADALRYMPGMQVARVDSRTWAITSRGFNSSVSDKLLVMIDGRTVYTPLFSGVFWDSQDTFMPDIDRIEVTRGPGATMWGANAVNGVVSITTKDARYTQGGLISITAGSDEPGFASIRYGGEVDNKFYYRVYVQSSQRDDLPTVTGNGDGNGSQMTQTGFRIDSAMPADQGSFSLSGDYYNGQFGTSPGESTPLSGGNLTLNASRVVSDDLVLSTTTYFDYVSRSVYQQYGETQRTFNVDTQLRYSHWDHHDIIAGLQFRNSSDSTDTGVVTTFSPERRNITEGSAFVQDEMRWKDGRYGLIVGSKFERHQFSGFDVEPSIRGAYRTGGSTLWAAISRAVRTPSRFDEDVVVFPRRPILIGNDNFKSETLTAYELGYRAQWTSTFTWDMSVFVNHYDDLRSRERIPLSSRSILGNELDANTAGIDLTAKWQVSPRWRLEATYTHLTEHFSLDAGSTDPTGGYTEYDDPKNMASIRSSLQVTPGLRWSLGFRYVSSLPNPAQKSYVTADMKFAYRFRGRWEIDLTGQNLLQKDHTEFGASSPLARQVPREVYGSVIWQF
ncbi:MAG TPA: TonB-dependent receptor, partial [Opitutaceae bacterium]